MNIIEPCYACEYKDQQISELIEGLKKIASHLPDQRGMAKCQEIAEELLSKYGDTK